MVHDLSRLQAEAGDPEAARARLDDVLERTVEHRDGADHRAAAALREQLTGTP